MTTKFWIRALSVVLSLGLYSCGNKDQLALKGVDVGTSLVNQHTYVNFGAIVVIGKLKFPNIEVPILDPTTMTSFGQLALQRLADGTNKLMVSIDFESATRLNPTLGYGLPNGREIPLVLGAQNTALIGIPVLQNSRIYVGGDLHKDLFIGAAIAVPAFDNIMNQVAIPLNIFTSFPFSSSVTGVGGLFTSPAPGQNGLALFAKRSAQNQVISTMRVARESLNGETSAPAEAPSELNELNMLTKIRLNYLMNRRAIIKVK